MNLEYPVFYSFFQIHNFQNVLQMFPVSTAAEMKVIIINTLKTHKRPRIYTSFPPSKVKASSLSLSPYKDMNLVLGSKTSILYLQTG